MKVRSPTEAGLRSVALADLQLAFTTFEACRPLGPS